MWGVNDLVGGHHGTGGRRLNGVRTDEMHTEPDVRLLQRSAFLTGHRTTELSHAYGD